MTNEQILKQVIEKAVKNGWKVPFRLRKFIESTISVGSPDIELLFDNVYFGYIFSHDFAKAFWGEKLVDTLDDSEQTQYPNYLYHLQQMVLEKEPILYLSKFLDD